ncbi:MAG: hypothetical protein KKG99_04015 [Bacteroidetes bacterium]|nr:hypothetical protein [Bacteroidota bacterium]
MKRNIIRSISLVVLVLLIAAQLNAQEKPFRIGVKVGFPNILTGNIEYVTPLVEQRLAFMIDYSTYSFNDQDVSLNYSYFEAGINYYLRREGHGPYVAISYTNMNVDLTYENVESDQNSGEFGSATAGIGMNTLNIKLGAKWGGLIYFRPEIGYSFTPLPNTIDIQVNFNNSPSEIHIEEVPSIITGGLIFNIGFGFSF